MKKIVITFITLASFVSFASTQISFQELENSFNEGKVIGMDDVKDIVGAYSGRCLT